MKRNGSALWLTGLVLGLCCNAHAAEPQKTTHEVMHGGLKVGIDAETGQLRPLTPSESALLDQMLTQGQQAKFAPGMARTFNAPSDAAAARATVRRNAGGGVSVKLPESQMSSVIARRDASGQLLIEHADADAPATTIGGLPND